MKPRIWRTLLVQTECGEEDFKGGKNFCGVCSWGLDARPGYLLLGGTWETCRDED